MTSKELKTLGEYYSNKLRAEKQLADVLDAVKHRDSNLILLDVRDPEDYAKSHIEGAISAPLNQIDNLPTSLFDGKEVVTYCYSQTCHLSTMAALKLVRRGIPAREMNVGWKEWSAAAYPSRVPELGQTCEKQCQMGPTSLDSL